MKAHPADCPGWIYETHESGARLVKDRCMTCNQPPWYRKRRRQRIIQRFWPLIFGGSIYVAGFVMVWAIVLYQRWFG